MRIATLPTLYYVRKKGNCYHKIYSLHKIYITNVLILTDFLILVQLAT